MRYSQSEKMEIIRLVEQCEIGVVRTLKELGLPTSTFYKWYGRYREEGYDGLAPKAKQQRQFWNQLPPWERQRVVEIALERPELSPRELAHHITDHERWFISESTVYRILKSKRTGYFTCLHRHGRFRLLQRQDKSSASDVANGLHLLESGPLGSILPLHGAGRLFTGYHSLGVVQ